MGSNEPRSEIHYATPDGSRLACGAQIGYVSWTKSADSVTCAECLRVMVAVIESMRPAAVAVQDLGLAPLGDKAILLRDVSLAQHVKRQQAVVISTPRTWAWAYRCLLLGAELEKGRTDPREGSETFFHASRPATTATEHRLDEDALPPPAKKSALETFMGTHETGLPKMPVIITKPACPGKTGMPSVIAAVDEFRRKQDNPSPAECFHAKPASLITYGDIYLDLVKETSNSAMHVYRKTFGVMTVEIHVGMDKFTVYRPGTRMAYHEGWELTHALCAVDEMVQGVREAIEGVEA